MAGGTWKTQNKARAGVYIVFETTEQTMGTLGERGVASLPLSLSWGPSKQVITVEAGADTKDVLGYDVSAPELLPLRESLKRASKVLLYRLNAGTAATATNTTLTVTANHGGARGNDIRIIVQNNIDDPAKFDIITLLAGEVMDTQIVAEIEELVANNWVKFSGTGAPDVTAGLNLTGGADGTVTNGDHTDYLSKIEGYDFNTIGLLSTDATLKPVYTAAIKRMRDQEGKKVQVVMPDYAAADYEGVISVKNGVLADMGVDLSQLVITIAYPAYGVLTGNATIQKRIDVGQFAQGGINLQIKMLDGIPLIPVASSRMKSAFVFKDGETAGQEAGGFEPATDAKNVNWIVSPRTAPIGISKTDKVRIFTPDENQQADAWKLDYRKYHDVIIPNNKTAAFRVTTGA